MATGRRLPKTDALAALLLVVLAATGCSANSAKKSYVLAETLWTDAKYAAAVSEFEKVAARDPTGSLGLQALYRAAHTQAYFLAQYGEAIRKFQRYVDISPDVEKSWDAQLQIGELLFSKLEHFEPAIQHYRRLLKLRAETQETPEFLFRIAKSHFFLWQFDDAVQTFREVVKRFPQSPMAERALYEIGVTHFTRGEQHPGGSRARGSGTEAYQEAIDAYQRLIKLYPNSTLIPQAKFGIASCLEELDQLDAAYHAYEALKSTYPSPNVILIKLHRIRERKAQRSR